MGRVRIGARQQLVEAVLRRLYDRNGQPEAFEPRTTSGNEKSFNGFATVGQVVQALRNKLPTGQRFEIHGGIITPIGYATPCTRCRLSS